MEFNFEVNNISCEFNDPFLTDLKNISFKVRVGEIFGIAGVAGNGQSELMDILTGENIDISSGEIIFNKNQIQSFGPQKRRDLSISFVPENRLGHSAVPELSLSENILLSQFPKNNFLKNGIILKNNVDNYANNVIRDFNVDFSIFLFLLPKLDPILKKAILTRFSEISCFITIPISIFFSLSFIVLFFSFGNSNF